MTPASDGPVALHAGEGLHHAAALHFMVVLADQVFLAANVQAAEHGLEEFRLIHAAVFDAGVRDARALPIRR